MKSIERRFNNITEEGLSTYGKFAEAIRDQGFDMRGIRFWFNKLVDKADYAGSDRAELIQHLYSISNPE